MDIPHNTSLSLPLPAAGMQSETVSVRPSVLVADDDAISSLMVSRVLQRSGYHVVNAADGETALRMIEESEVRIVITDWQMPGLSGIELCRSLRQRDLGSYIYTILLTGSYHANHAVEALNAGADDFLTKPFNPAELIARVQVAERILSMESRDMVIFAMAKLAETRDNDTGKHLERVQNYCRVLAEAMSLNPRYSQTINREFIRLLQQTVPLHDIGKVGIPDAVLLKPGKLTPDEFEIIKTHTVIGGQTLQAALDRTPNANFLRMARDIALSHHEKWDGSGYPLGIAGMDIPLSGRLVAVADVYDALTTKRVYKDAFSHEKAFEIIVDDRGRHFDPDVVDAFLLVADDFNNIRRRMSE